MQTILEKTGLFGLMLLLAASGCKRQENNVPLPAQPRDRVRAVPAEIVPLQFTLPQTGQITPAPVRLRAGGSALLFPAQVLADGDWIWTLTNATQTGEWRAPAGTHRLTLIDREGRQEAIQITVRSNIAPVVNAQFGTHISYQPQLPLRARTDDPDGRVIRLAFRNEMGYIGDARPEAGAVIWSNPGLGKHHLRIEACDASGICAAAEKEIIIDFSGGLLGFWSGESLPGASKAVRITRGICGAAYEFLPGGWFAAGGAYNVSKGFTWSAWVYLPAQPTQQLNLFSKWRERENPRLSCRGALLPDRTLVFSVADRWNQHNPAYYDLRSPSALAVHRWNHVACIYDGDTGQRSVWINGSLAAQQQDQPSSLMESDVPLTFGDPDNRDIFRLDDVGLYNRAVSGPEIRLIANNPGISIFPP